MLIPKCIQKHTQNMEVIFKHNKFTGEFYIFGFQDTVIEVIQLCDLCISKYVIGTQQRGRELHTWAMIFNKDVKVIQSQSLYQAML